jgi:hypothetical protein
MPLSWNEIRDRAIMFSREWADESSEHAEAKSFWDGFFNVFGVNRRRVAAFEKHVQKASGGSGFIDLFWPGILLAEHKSRGKDLSRAHSQAIDYFPGLSDKELPRYVIVSDFARFRIHDLDDGTETEIHLEDLHQHVEQFGFIAGYEARQFKEQDPVNIEAAELLGKLHDELKYIGYDGHQLEVYLVRILFCLFAEDTGIFMPRSAFEDLILTRTSEDGSDLASRLNEFFDVLNTPSEERLKNLDDQLAAFPYINGKLFEENLRTASFDRSMRETLLQCCELDWGAISPAIFGSLFQGIMDSKVRRNLGAHYTSEANILKLIQPLFLDDLWAEFEKIKNRPVKLKEFHSKLEHLNFFDPACGCGNFLVITYREIRLLELEVIKVLHSKEMQQLSLDVVEHYVNVDVDQFHGIEIEEWPSQIARVAMWLMDHQMNLLVGKAFGNAIVRIPLVKSANIVNGNALSLNWNDVLQSKKCSYVLGNPPFSGAMVMGDQQRADQNAVLSDIQGSGVLDFVACWYWLAGKYIDKTSIKVGLVSTNSIVQGEQVALLWEPLMMRYGVHINFAHRTFQWSNEAKGVAAVHCVIVGFSTAKETPCTLFDYDTLKSDPHAIKVKNINAYLIDADDIFLSNKSEPICEVPHMRFGSMPRDGGNLILSDDEYEELIAAEPDAKKWLRRYTGAKEFLNGGMRWCLWLINATPSDLKNLPGVLKRVDATRNFRLHSKAEATRKFAETPSLFCQIAQPETNYLLVPGVSSERRPKVPVGFFGPETIASNLVFVVPGATQFNFGVISSEMHMAWMKTVCGRLKSDYRYSKDLVYNNFPWPIDVTDKQKLAIERASQGVLDARAMFPDEKLANLYNPLIMPAELVKAHRALDQAVDAAYVPCGGKKKWRSDAERVAFLFSLYQQIVDVDQMAVT